MDAIILAGGLGTRLKSEISNKPKSMALIKSKPFLEYQMDNFVSNGIKRFILSVGYKSESIKEHFGDNFRNCEIVYAIEDTPLGTGGAIKNAMNYVKDDHVVIANGDSLFLVDIREQLKFHLDNNADATLALKPMMNFERYGTVDVLDNGKITGFSEKKYTLEGIINGGLYIFDVKSFKGIELPDKFSIEKDFFESYLNQLHIYGFISDKYFLDIGIPEDYWKAQYEIALFPRINSSWTLFLVRDGVINVKKDNDYVKSLREFEVIPGIPKAIAGLSKIFGRIIVVTNQQGIGKGLMKTEDLIQIHSYMLEIIKQEGGHIDAIYHAPQLEEEESPMRKPGIGMALQAQKDFPEIDFKRSIMAGDSQLDLEFGNRANMVSVLIGSDIGNQQAYALSSLTKFQEILESIL